MLAIIKKELKSYLLTPIGYIFIGLFMLMFGIIFFVGIYQSRYLNFEYVFADAVTILTFITPILTMRMFAEERKNGTEQLILTSPRSLISVVLGKFNAALIIILLTLACTLVHFAILNHFGKPNLKIALATLLGTFLLSMSYASFGMFVSSITENQIIACVLTVGVLIALMFLPNINAFFESISLIYMFDKFAVGVIALDTVVYFVSFTALFILLTIIVLQRRKSVK